MQIRSFRHITPPLRLFAGDDSLRMLGRELDRVNSRKAVVFCGPSLARNTALMSLITSALGERCAGVFAGVRAHSPVPAVIEGAEQLKRLQADAVIAVGGGSAVVSARASSILLAEGYDVSSLCTSRDERGELKSPRLLAPKLPQFVIPTTPNTAVVKAGSAVLDPVAGQRRALFDHQTRAQSVFIHPDMLMSAPVDLVVSASVDSIILAVEGLLTGSGDSISDALLMHAVRLVSRHITDPGLDKDAGVRTALMLAAILAGQGSDYTGGAMATVLGHAIGAHLDVGNGIPKAIMVPHTLRFNADAGKVGIAKLATALGLSPSGNEPIVESVARSLERVFTQLGLPRRLRDIGVSTDRLPAMAEAGMGDWFLRGNPRPVRDASELKEVLEAAW